MKRILLICLVLVLAVSFIACKKQGTGSSSAGIKLSYMHWGDDYERQMYADVIKGYMAKTPGVTIEQLFVPGMNEYWERILTSQASGTIPDLFWTNEARFAEFAKQGLMEDLEPYIKKYPNILDDMIDGLNVYGEYNGKQYAIPKDWTSYVMYINVDLFKKAGIPIPSSNWTMDDYVNIARQMTRKEGNTTAIYGVAVNNYRIDHINFMGNFDAPWFKNGKSNVSDPLAVKGLSYMMKVISDGSAPSPGSVSATGDSEDRLFIIGKVAMYPSGRWAVPSFREECDFEWTAIEMPKGTTRCTPFCAGQVCISSKSPNKDQAASFLAYHQSDEGLLIPMSSALAMPAYKRLLTNPRYVTTPPATDAFMATAGYIGNEPQHQILQTGRWAEFWDIMYAELSLAFEGQQTIEQAAQNIDSKANARVFN